MLAVNSKRYQVPRKIKEGEDVLWALPCVGNSKETLQANKFTYTYLYDQGKASFIYDGSSVKPSPRTLRVFGATKVGRVVKYLASNTEQRSTVTYKVLSREFDAIEYQDLALVFDEDPDTIES